jgi:uncharacterized protein (TIGR03000 family)
MFRKALSFGIMLVLAGAAVFGTPSSGLAQRHGGGYRYGYPQTYSYRHNGYYSQYPSYRYYAGYGYYPNYYSEYSPFAVSGSGYDLGYSNSNGAVVADAYPYDNPRLQPDLRDSGSYGAVTPTNPYGSFSYSPSAARNQTLYYPSSTFTLDNTLAQSNTTAHITVTVPANGEVWFNGSETTSTGTVREYQSPPLTPGSRYTYEVRVRWNANGHEVTQTQRVGVTAGAHVNVSFLGSAQDHGTSVGR